MLYDKLRAYCPGATPMHMPGHKRNSALFGYLNGLSCDIDITEIDDFDDLHAPTGVLYSSMRSAAEMWHSDECRFLVNGATSGVLSAIYALAKEGDKAIVSRCAHKSV